MSEWRLSALRQSVLSAGSATAPSRKTPLEELPTLLRAARGKAVTQLRRRVSQLGTRGAATTVADLRSSDGVGVEHLEFVADSPDPRRSMLSRMSQSSVGALARRSWISSASTAASYTASEQSPSGKQLASPDGPGCADSLDKDGFQGTLAQAEASEQLLDVLSSGCTLRLLDELDMYILELERGGDVGTAGRAILQLVAALPLKFSLATRCPGERLKRRSSSLRSSSLQKLDLFDEEGARTRHQELLDAVRHHLQAVARGSEESLAALSRLSAQGRAALGQLGPGLPAGLGPGLAEEVEELRRRDLGTRRKLAVLVDLAERMEVGQRNAALRWCFVEIFSSLEGSEGSVLDEEVPAVAFDTGRAWEEAGALADVVLLLLADACRSAAGPGSGAALVRLRLLLRRSSERMALVTADGASVTEIVIS